MKLEILYDCAVQTKDGKFIASHNFPLSDLPNWEEIVKRVNLFDQLVKVCERLNAHIDRIDPEYNDPLNNDLFEKLNSLPNENTQHTLKK